MKTTLRKALLFALIGCFVAGSVGLIMWNSLRTTQLSIRYVSTGRGLALKKYSGTSANPALVIPNTAPDSTGIEQPVTALLEFSISNSNYLEELFIGANVKEIHPWAVTNCEQLRMITVDANNPWFASLDGVLYSRDMARLVLFPNSNAQNENFTIPDSVTVISENAFYRCRKLQAVTFPSGLKELEEKAFFRCSELKTLRLPEGLEVIGVDAFAFCDGLEGEITIPASVREVRQFAFSSKNSKISKIIDFLGN
ncbi:MAG: leucine-rich repeat domain-containing protein [Oscillospiraceae bacterium]|nr:leucine-rich repeat domain-containing protein [Oscillospiraceae bacterium]